MKVRTYSEMCEFEAYEDRFEYLVLGGTVGRSTFGFDRHINQSFYHSYEWQNVREYVIARDEGCDLAAHGFDIPDAPLVHHMNPMTSDDIIQHKDWILDAEYLITTSHETHNDIHYGNRRQPSLSVDREPGDTRLW